MPAHSGPVAAHGRGHPVHRSCQPSRPPSWQSALVRARSCRPRRHLAAASPPGAARAAPDLLDRRAVLARTTAPAGAAPSTGPAGRGRWRSPPARRRPRPAAAPPRRGPTATPPTPTMGTLGEGRPALPHGPHRHRVHRAAREPAPAGAEDGPARLGVEGQAEQGVDQREAVGAALEGARRRSRPRRARWGSAWPTAAGRTRWPPAPRAVASAEWANIRERSSTLGQLTLTSSATMQRAAPPRRAAVARRARAARRVVRDRSGPRC